jgi:hypothetical protein
MMTRGVLGIVAVTLLWCTSFALLDAQVVKYVKTPAQGAIRTQCDAAISYTKESRADYEKCVNVQVDKCDAAYGTRLKDTAKTSFYAQKHNVLVLKALAANVGTCTSSLTLALQLIDEWVVAPDGKVDQAKKKALNEFGYNSHLGATCAGISDIIGHSAESTADSQVSVAYQRQREAVYELAYQYSEYSQSVAESAFNYSEQLVSYEVNYTTNLTALASAQLGKIKTTIPAIKVKALAAINQTFVALAEGLPGYFSPHIAEVQANIAPLIAQHAAFELLLQQKLDALFTDYERNKVEVLAYQQAVLEYKSAVEEYVRALRTQSVPDLGGIVDLGPVIQDTIALIQADFTATLPAARVDFTFTLPPPDIAPAMLSPKQITAPMVEAVAAAGSEVTDAAGQAAGSVTEMGTVVVGMIKPFDAPPYEPPQYSHKYSSPGSGGGPSGGGGDADDPSTISGSLADARANLKAKGDGFLELTSMAADSIAQAALHKHARAATSNVELGSFNTSAFGIDANKLSTTFSYFFKDPEQFFLAEDLDFNFVVLASLATVATNFDIIYRIIQSAFQILRFWRSTGLGLAPISHTSTARNCGGIGFLERKYFTVMGAVHTWTVAPFERLLRRARGQPAHAAGHGAGQASHGNGNGVALCALPSISWASMGMVTAVMFGVVITVFFVGLFLLGYIPLFKHYLGGCVATGAPFAHNGTMLTNNMYTVAYQYASESGNSAASTRLKQYNYRLDNDCKDPSVAYTTQHSTDLDTFSAKKALFELQDAKVVELQTCLNMSFFDGLHADAVGGNWPLQKAGAAAGQRQPRLSDVLGVGDGTGAANSAAAALAAGTGGCDAGWRAGIAAGSSGYAVQDATFSCDDLPICTLTCNGPSKTELRDATRKCGCTLEWWFHAGSWSFTMAVSLYVCLNVARMLILRALVRLSWERLEKEASVEAGVVAMGGDNQIIGNHVLSNIVNPAPVRRVVVDVVQILPLQDDNDQPVVKDRTFFSHRHTPHSGEKYREGAVYTGKGEGSSATPGGGAWGSHSRVLDFLDDAVESRTCWMKVSASLYFCATAIVLWPVISVMNYVSEQDLSYDGR